MNKTILSLISIIFVCNSIFGQTKEKNVEDVKSVDVMLIVFYDVNSS